MCICIMSIPEESQLALGKHRRENINRLPRNWKKKIADYQDRIRYGTQTGIAADKTCKKLGIDVNSRDLALIYAIRECIKMNNLKLHQKVEVPVQMLWAMISPYKAELYDRSKTVSEEYMPREISDGSLQKLVQARVIYVKKHNHSEHQCRTFNFHPRFVDEFRATVFWQLIELEKLEMPFGYDPSRYGDRPSRRGIGLDNKKALHPITEAAFQKLRKCRYRINRDILDQGFLRSLPQFEKSTIDHRESIMAALRHVNFHRDGAIYTPQWNMQSNGRMYTIGGLMALPGYVRKAIMRPVEKGNLLVEVDAISAHLLFNCDRFGCPEVKELLLESSRSTGTVWHVIGDPDMKKKLKKPIVYGFCYGSRYSNLPYHANNHFIKQYGYNYGVTLKHVDACLKQGILAPLVEAREEWIQRHNHSGVIGTHNRLGYAFEPTTKDCGCCVENLGSRLLAHLNFGEEQYYLQQMVAASRYNLTYFAYDGFCYEVPGEELEESIRLFSGLVDIPLSFEVIYGNEKDTPRSGPKRQEKKLKSLPIRDYSDGCNREGSVNPITSLNYQNLVAAETFALYGL